VQRSSYEADLGMLWYSEIQAQLEKYDLENRQAEHIVDR
jgi:hypothetical protein